MTAEHIASQMEFCDAMRRNPPDSQKKTAAPQTGRRRLEAVPAGFEPTTPGFGGQYSIQLSYETLRLRVLKARGSIHNSKAKVLTETVRTLSCPR